MIKAHQAAADMLSLLTWQELEHAMRIQWGDRAIVSWLVAVSKGALSALHYLHFNWRQMNINGFWGNSQWRHTIRSNLNCWLSRSPFNNEHNILHVCSVSFAAFSIKVIKLTTWMVPKSHNNSSNTWKSKPSSKTYDRVLHPPAMEIGRLHLLCFVRKMRKKNEICREAKPGYAPCTVKDDIRDRHHPAVCDLLVV